MIRKFLLIWLAIPATVTLWSQENILQATIATADLYAHKAISFTLLDGSDSYTLTPADKDLTEFSVSRQDGREYRLRFAREIEITDAQGFVVYSSDNGKEYFPVGNLLLSKQISATGIHFVDDKGKKVFSATRDWEGLFPSTVDIAVKSWTSADMPFGLLLISAAEMLRQTYFYEG